MDTDIKELLNMNNLRMVGITSGRALLPIIFSFVFALAMFVPLYPVMESLQESYPDSITVYVLFYGLEVFLMGFGILLYLKLVTWWDKYPFDEWSIIHWRRPTLKDFGLGIGLTIVAMGINFVLGIIIWVLGYEMAENAVMEPGMHDPMYFLYMIPVMILLVGPVEELIFRGAVQGAIREMCNVKVGLVVASILFGLVHLPAVGGLSVEAIPYIGAVTVLGFVFGYIYEEKKSLFIPALAHGLYNSLLLLMQYYFEISDIEMVLVFL